MKLYQLDLSKRGIGALSMTERPTPNAGPGQVLIRLRAFSLNFRDLLIANGLYPVSVKSDRLIPVSDGAGEVIETGAGVTRFAKGDRVLASYFQGWIDGPLTYPAMGTSLGGGIDGVLAEYVALPEQGVVKIPAGLSFEEAATLPCAGVTAWHALVETGRLQSGQSVLVLGTGGVSVIGLQIAKGKGARVIVTSSSDEKLARAKALGADGAINYKTTPDWDQEVLKLTNGAGVDHVLEVGGAGTLPKSLQAVGIHGQVNIIGVLTGLQNNIDFLPVLVKTARIQGILVGSRGMLERLIDALAASRTKPVIDKVFTFDQAIDAYRYLEAAHHFGKVVIRV
jgi:NADPH:quinone reductase-like Zn-dependent oxidoreductase